MTSYGLHPLLITATSFIITSFNLHLQWTSTISPHNSVCYNLHLSWTTRRQKADYIWISTSHGPPYYGHKVIYIDSTPLTTSYGLFTLLIIVTSSINISWNLHLPWTSTVSPHNSVFLWSPPLMDHHTAEGWLYLNLHLPWTTVHSAEGITYWIYTSSDLLWTSPIVDHCYIIHRYLRQSPPPVVFHNFSIYLCML